MKIIALRGGDKATVDDDDYMILIQWEWKSNKLGYVYRTEYLGKKNGVSKYKRFWMHAEILGSVKGKIIDHADMNPRNNQKSNLRFCTREQNRANSKTNENSKSGVRGVYFHKAAGKWAAQIQTKKQKHYLGTFPTISEAASAYNNAALVYFREFARFNDIEALK